MADEVNPNRHINSVVVFCGSRPGARPVYEQEAAKLGALLAKNNYELVYGSGTVGLMGAVSGAAQAEGGTIHGVNVHMFAETQGSAREGVRETVTDTMFARKAEMLNASQASICLPGGIGTIDEAGEVLVEDDIMKHHSPDGIVKPVILINTKLEDGSGYYDNFLAQLQVSLKEGFTSANIGRYYTQVPNAEVAVQLLNALNVQGPMSISRDAFHPLDPSYAPGYYEAQLGLER